MRPWDPDLRQGAVSAVDLGAAIITDSCSLLVSGMIAQAHQQGRGPQRGVKQRGKRNENAARDI